MAIALLVLAGLAALYAYMTWRRHLRRSKEISRWENVSSPARPLYPVAANNLFEGLAERPSTQESREQLLRLRLNARVLLEWKTPSTAREYRTTLDRIIQFSEIARERGFQATHPILDLDRNGAILRFLSEYMTLEEPPPSREYDYGMFSHYYYSGSIRSLCASRLEPTSRNEATPAMQRYSSGALAEEILYNLQLDDRTVVEATVRLLMGLLVPFPSPLIVEMVDTMAVLSRGSLTKTIRRRRSGRTRALIALNVGWLAKKLGEAFCFLALLILGALAYTQFKNLVFFIHNGSVEKLALVLAIVAVLVMILIRVGLAVRRAYTAWMDAVMRVETSIADDRLQGAIDPERFSSLLFGQISRECGKNPALWRYMVRQNEDWPFIMLCAIKDATEEVVEAALAELESTHLLFSRKAAIFVWLISVTVVRNQRDQVAS